MCGLWVHRWADGLWHATCFLVCGASVGGEASNTPAAPQQQQRAATEDVVLHVSAVSSGRGKVSGRASMDRALCTLVDGCVEGQEMPAACCRESADSHGSH